MYCLEKNLGGKCPGWNLAMSVSSRVRSLFFEIQIRSPMDPSMPTRGCERIACPTRLLPGRRFVSTGPMSIRPVAPSGSWVHPARGSIWFVGPSGSRVHPARSIRLAGPSGPRVHPDRSIRLVGPSGSRVHPARGSIRFAPFGSPVHMTHGAINSLFGGRDMFVGDTVTDG